MRCLLADKPVQTSVVCDQQSLDPILASMWLVCSNESQIATFLMTRPPTP